MKKTLLLAFTISIIISSCNSGKSTTHYDLIQKDSTIMQGKSLVQIEEENKNYIKKRLESPSPGFCIYGGPKSLN